MSNTYKTKGVCAKSISFAIEGTKVKDVIFHGGCDGSHLGIENLVKGMEVEDVIEKLKGVTCQSRSTSCPDQLACALEEYKNATM